MIKDKAPEKGRTLRAFASSFIMPVMLNYLSIPHLFFNKAFLYVTRNQENNQHSIDLASWIAILWFENNIILYFSNSVFFLNNNHDLLFDLHEKIF